MKFRKTMFYSIKRLIPFLGIAGATAFGAASCEKEDDMKTQMRSMPTQHDTVYVNKTDTLKPDTVYIPGDSIFFPGDTIYLHGDTIYLPGDTVFTPRDTIYLPGDTIYTPSKSDTIYLPSKPDTIYTPSKPDTIYLPSKPDTIYTPSKPDTIYLPSKPDTIYVPVDNTPHHNTTYIWGRNFTDNVYPATNISKSCDSLLVDTVFLKNNGVSWEGASTTTVLKYMTKVLDDVKSDNKHKIRGAGTLNDVGMGTEQTYQDSIKLAKMGFKFGRVYY